MPSPSEAALPPTSPDDYLFEAPAYEGVEEARYPKPVPPGSVKPVSAPTTSDSLVGNAEESLVGNDAMPVAQAVEVAKETSQKTTVSSEIPDQVQQDVVEGLPPVSSPEPSEMAANKPESPMIDTASDGVVEDAPGTSEDNKWYELLPELKLGGMAKQLAEHCLFREQLDDKIVLSLDNAGVTLQTNRTEEAMVEALSQYFAKEIRLEFEVSHSIGETPEKRRIRLAKERQLEAEQSIEQDPFVNELREKWGGVVLPGSVKPNLNVDTF